MAPGDIPYLLSHIPDKQKAITQVYFTLKNNKNEISSPMSIAQIKK